MKKNLARFVTTIICCAAGGLGLGATALGAENSLATQWMAEAQAAYAKGDRARAMQLVDRVIQETPESAQAHYFRGRLHEEARRHVEAIESYSLALKFDPKAAGVYQRRGCERFRLGQFTEALDDFDRFLKLAPQQEAHHWQRGIAYYYAGLYAKGRDQFQLHQTVNPNDVENAVWHFLCVARLDGVERARAALIPISGDRRVPMTEVHALFAGKGTTNQVESAVVAGDPEPAELGRRRFYADLYLGLYFEALGDSERTQAYIERAAAVAHEHNYMGDVARVHANVLKKSAPKAPQNP